MDYPRYCESSLSCSAKGELPDILLRNRLLDKIGPQPAAREVFKDFMTSAVWDHLVFDKLDLLLAGYSGTRYA
jgi:hypothetical protein